MKPPAGVVASRLVVAAGAGWLVGGVVGAVGGASAAVAVPWWLDRSRAGPARLRVDDDLATIVELAARASRSGLSLTQALNESGDAVGGDAAALVESLLTLAATAPLQAACHAWAARHDVAAVRVVAAAVGVAASGSGSGARALEAAARSIRNRRAGRRELEAWSTQARASAVLLASAPVAFAGLTVATRSMALAEVFEQPAALASIAVGAVAEVAGAWWMLRLVARAQAEA